MEIGTRRIGDAAIIDVSGRMVAGELLLLRQTIAELVARDEKNIVLNLQDVPYIDSAGIGELVSALVVAREQRRCLKLTSLKPKVREVLDIVKLLTEFQVFDHLAEAIPQACFHNAARAS